MSYRILLSYGDLVERRIFNNRTTLSRAIKSYGFPHPYKLGARRVMWDEKEVEKWIANRRAVDRPENR